MSKKTAGKDDDPPVPADFAAWCEGVMKESPRMADWHVANARAWLLAIAVEMESGRTEFAKTELMQVAVALRAYAEGKTLEPPRKRGNPRLVRRGLWNPAWTAYEVHKLVRAGHSQFDACNTVAVNLDADPSTVQRAYREQKKKLLAIDDRLKASLKSKD